MDTSTLLPIGPTARHLRVPVAWLRAEADAGRVPCLRAGRAYLFVLEAVERLLAERAAAETADGRPLAGQAAEPPAAEPASEPAAAEPAAAEPEPVMPPRCRRPRLRPAESTR